jgi:hypothetical protein
MWLVLLESAKDRFLGVDTPKQPMDPHVRYGMTCLLIRNTMGSVSCWVVWKGYQDYMRAARCKRGHGIMYYPRKP